MAINLVGTPVAGTAGNGGNVTLTLPTMQQDDVVVLIGSTGVGAATGGAPGDYTAALWETATAPNLGHWYKRQGATPDTTVLFTGTGSGVRATVAVAFVLRGVDTTTALDTAAVANTTSSDPPSITTVTAAAWVIASSAQNVNDATWGTITNYGNTVGGAQNDTNPTTVAAATREIATAGAENPGAWSGLTTAGIAVTTAWRPAAGGGTPDPVTATLTGTLPTLTGAAAADTITHAALTGTLPALTGTVAANTVTHAALAGALPALTGTATAEVPATAALNGTLPALTGGFAGNVGDVITVALNGTLPTLTAAADGAVDVTALLAADLPQLVAVATAETTIGAALAGTLPGLVGALSGGVVGAPVTATLDGILPVLVGAIRTIDPDSSRDITITLGTPTTHPLTAGTPTGSLLATIHPEGHPLTPHTPRSQL